MVDMVAELECT